MATNLLWGYSDIPRKGTLTVVPDANTSFPATNVCLGPRRKIYQGGISLATHRLTWDLGSSTTRAVDYLYIARANLLWARDSTVAVALESSSDNVTWTSRIASSPIASGDKVGPRTEDYIKTTTQTSAFRYWRLTLNNTGSTTILPALSKVMFGPAFDFGRDPSWSRALQRTVLNRGVRESRYTLQLEYRAIPNSTLQSFVTEIIEYRDIAPVVLFTTSVYHELLNSAKAMHLLITEFQVLPINVNNSTLVITLEEQL
jgi:hypothetical protein